MTSSLLRTDTLVLAGGVPKPDLEVGPGYTEVIAPPESSATVHALTLAGRMKPHSGTISLRGEKATPRALFRAVAFAGTLEIDALERQVSVRDVVREQAAWAGPWYGRTPRAIADIKAYTTWADCFELTLDESDAVGDLTPCQRLQLRCVLGLMARPQASLFLLDDIDQLRSTRDQEETKHALRRVAQHLPVLVFTANGEETR